MGKKYIPVAIGGCSYKIWIDNL
jgi:hypothetical protein